MPPGAVVRRNLGPFEERAVHAYRAWYVDLDEMAVDIGALGPFRRVLEVGAGDGALADALVGQHPETTLLGIDIMATPGRMSAGVRTQFRQCSTTDLLDEQVEPFDLVVLSDVLHHVPPAERTQLLVDATRLAGPGATLVVKEWERRPGLAHRAADFSDRYVSGDRGVSFLSRQELLDLLDRSLDGWRVHAECRIPPRRNNLLLALRAH